MGRSDDLRKLSTAWNDAWNSRQVEQLASFFAETGTYYEPDLPAPVPGRAGIGDIAAKTWSDWPDVTFDIVSVVIEESRVALEWHSSAKHKSGAEVQLEGVDMLTWDGDKLSEARVYYDVHSRKSALGET